jgi:hypothetical protein
MYVRIHGATLDLPIRVQVYIRCETTSGSMVIVFTAYHHPRTDAGQKLVGVERFELPTHCSQSSCATRLRYTPTLASQQGAE